MEATVIQRDKLFKLRDKKRANMGSHKRSLFLHGWSQAHLSSLHHGPVLPEPEPSPRPQNACVMTPFGMIDLLLSCIVSGWILVTVHEFSTRLQEFQDGTLFYHSFLLFAVLAPCSAVNKPLTITCSSITDVFLSLHSTTKSPFFLSRRFYWGYIYVWKLLSHFKWSAFCSDKLLVKSVFRARGFVKWW